jgi:hypothetical protein
MTAADSPVFPLKLSANRRYLVDQKDRPFLVHGDTAWSLITAVTKEDAGRYLEDRRRKGFNAIIVNLIEHFFNGPINRDGEGPFVTAGDFAKPNEKYFAHADWVLRKAREKGITVFLFPMYLGYKGTDEGWYQEALLNGMAKCRNYGRYLGNRYKDYKNIVWTLGGDRNPEPELAEDAVNAVVAGIRESMLDALFSAHPAPEFSGAEKYNLQWLDINSTYTYGIVHRQLLRDYDRKPTMPFVLMESTYEGEHNSSPVQIRRQAYWALLSGAAGQFLGNKPIWAFDPGWQAALNSEGSRSMAHLRSLFETRAWYDLVPDREHKIVVDGLGEFTGLDFASAARTTDRRTLLVYIPTGRTVVVDTAQIAGSRQRAAWFDPRSGGITSAGESAAGDKRSFKTPSEADWVLVVEDAALPLLATAISDTGR